MTKPILLSPPHLDGRELAFVQEAIASNWIAPLGPQVDAFETEFCQRLGSGHALAVNSGTSALHLALILVGVQPGDQVFCSTLTFIASAGPIVYLGASPVFIDCDPNTWTMDPHLLGHALDESARRGKLPKAVVAAHLYGQSADLDPILAACERHGVTLIEDAAQALGATYRGRAVGGFGRFAIFSFNSNKIITTSAGGMLVSGDPSAIEEARYLAMQARDPAPHYQHSRIGYNYRLSNVLAAMGRAQLRVLGDRVAARRRNFEFYKQNLASLPGLRFMPEAAYGTATRWLTCLTLDPEVGRDREQMHQALAQQHIESRPVCKPLHAQPVFQTAPRFGGETAEHLFARGLCLPSGSNLSQEDLQRVVDAFRSAYQGRSNL